MGKVNELDRRQTNGRRSYARIADEPSDEGFLYPQEYDDPAFTYPDQSRTVAIPPPAAREPRTRQRGERPMPRRLSEELEEGQPDESVPQITEKKPARKPRARRGSEAEQIELGLKSKSKRLDSEVRQRQILGVMLVAMSLLILLAILSYSSFDTAQAETRVGDLPAVFTRSDSILNANADTANNWLGLIGAMIAGFFINKTIGYASIIFPALMGWWSLALFRFTTKQRRRLTLATTFILISAILFSATVGTTQLMKIFPEIDREWSGAIGQFMGVTFTRLIGSIGALIIYATSFLVMLVFAIDLDVEKTFLRAKNSYTAFHSKLRLKLIEFWEKREAKRMAKAQRRAEIMQELESEENEEETAELVRKDIAAIQVKPVRLSELSQEESLPAPLSPPPPASVPEPAPVIANGINPARDIITIRRDEPAPQREPEARTPFLKVRPAPRQPLAQPIPRLSESREILGKGSSQSPLSRLTGGAIVIPATESRSGKRILPADIDDEASRAQTESKPERLTPKAIEPPLESMTELHDLSVQIGDEKALANDALPHSVDVAPESVVSEALIAEITKPVAKQSDVNLFTESEIIPENPYNEQLRGFRQPPLDLLSPVLVSDTFDASSDELTAKGTLLRDKLATFGVEIENITVTPGPVVTLYEFTPAEGVKVSQVGNLTDDIALAMKARGIRIIAPMPGRGTIGVEIPNDHPKMVHMSEMLASASFMNSKMNLPLALGKTISGDVYVDDLSKMPHLLIAGATGSGKSVGVNGIIASLLAAKTPRDLKFVIVDPKKIELSLYKVLRNHYLLVSPETGEDIVTTPQFAVLALKSLELEMDRRYDKLAKAGVRSLSDYNIRVSQGKLASTQELQHYHLPYIVVIIDELADLMITAGKEIETSICRLAQMARAVGIHLILATQRPSVDVITGVIKANFPARIAYQVAVKVDSRTILDSMGAEQLLGNGDMLYLPSGTPKPIRLQAPYISTEEVESIAEWVSAQKGPGMSYSRPWYLPSLKAKGVAGGADDSERDPMFEDAARIVFHNKGASTSMLQRRLRLGYGRAARIIDELERAGIVGPGDGSKPREVLVESEEELELLLAG